MQRKNQELNVFLVCNFLALAGSANEAFYARMDNNGIYADLSENPFFAALFTLVSLVRFLALSSSRFFRFAFAINIRPVGYITFYLRQKSDARNKTSNNTTYRASGFAGHFFVHDSPRSLSRPDPVISVHDFSIYRFIAACRWIVTCWWLKSEYKMANMRVSHSKCTGEGGGRAGKRGHKYG